MDSDGSKMAHSHTPLAHPSGESWLASPFHQGAVTAHGLHAVARPSTALKSTRREAAAGASTSRRNLTTGQGLGRRRLTVLQGDGKVAEAGFGDSVPGWWSGSSGRRWQRRGRRAPEEGEG
jgi:hypothetical protein